MENQTSALFTTTSTSNLENGNCTVESRVPASSVLSFSSTTSSADICVEIDDENNADRDTSSSLKRPLDEQEVCSVSFVVLKLKLELKHLKHSKKHFRILQKHLKLTSNKTKHMFFSLVYTKHFRNKL